MWKTTAKIAIQPDQPVDADHDQDDEQDAEAERQLRLVDRVAAERWADLRAPTPP